MVVCSKSSGCANGYLSDSSQSCCMTEEAQSYMNATHPGICNFCLGQPLIITIVPTI